MEKIAISLGDVNGISAEIIAKFLAKQEQNIPFIPCIYAPQEVFKRWAKIFSKSTSSTHYWDIFFNKVAKKQILFMGKTSEQVVIHPRKTCAHSGKISFSFFQQAVRDSLQKKVAALVTAPINKAALKLAGISYKGHTPLLAAMCKVENYAMAFSSPNCLLALVTEHIPLKMVAESITTKKILQTIILCNDYLKSYVVAKPKIAVCGLNPHAGEAGILGDEEQQIIIPAIKLAKKQGINAFGAVAGDSIFSKAKTNEVDAIIAMYHDQGLCGWKSIFFEESAQVSLGLPIIRTSVSHGTAFDIAGLGIAKENSLAYAFSLACKMVQNQHKIK